jgi:ATP-dependent RNA helicase RhlE
LHPSLLRGIKDLGFVRPTDIQAEAIPAALEGRDLIACAQTGSGKTAAFLLPILQGLIDAPRGKTRALVLVPTRELAAQVLADFKDLATHTPVMGAAVFGGVGHGPQEHAFRSGVQVIIATPGRLLDHLRSPYAKLDHVSYLVLDEADRMLDMGFLPEIRKILKYLPARRQTLFFSATMPPPIRALANDMLRNPVSMERQRQSGPPSAITQAVYPVAQELKSALLVRLLRGGDIQQALVFTRTKHRADRLARFLAQDGIKVDRIHGNRSQTQRTAALGAFKAGRIPVLVATDIAARGIDVDALGHVDQLRRAARAGGLHPPIGRTGRAEATGEAFTFVSPHEQSELGAIERAVGRKLPRVTLPDFDYTAKAQTRLEIPIQQRIAEIRARKHDERRRRDEKGPSPDRTRAPEPAAGGPEAPASWRAGGPSTGRRRSAAAASGPAAEPLELGFSDFRSQISNLKSQISHVIFPRTTRSRRWRPTALAHRQIPPANR